MILLLLFAQEVDVSLEAGLRRLNGTMRFDEAPAAGNRLHLDDLGMTDWEPTARVDTGATFGFHRVHASLGGFRAEGNDVLEAPKRWNETLFNAGERVTSRLDFMDLLIGWTTYAGGAIGDEITQIAVIPNVGLSLRYARAHWELASSAQGTDDDNLSALWPQAEFHLKIYYMSPVAVRADIAFGGIDAKDLEVWSGSASVGIGYDAGTVHASVLWQEESLSFLSTRGIQRNRMRWGWDGLVAEISIRF